MVYSFDWIYNDEYLPNESWMNYTFNLQCVFLKVRQYSMCWCEVEADLWLPSLHYFLYHSPLCPSSGPLLHKMQESIPALVPCRCSPTLTKPSEAYITLLWNSIFPRGLKNKPLQLRLEVASVNKAGVKGLIIQLAGQEPPLQRQERREREEEDEEKLEFGCLTSARPFLTQAMQQL